ncbi:MAG TPA: hypothetical protein GX715_16055, partial [Armatimonadetes bacterium]|nr:hypothetical protein [Armatimonadota bacterium]
MTDRHSYRAGLMAAIMLLGGSGAPALLADPPAGAARVSGEQEGMLQVKGGKLPEGPVEIRQEGAVTGFARVDPEGTARLVLGRAPKDAEIHPIAMPEPRVLLVAPPDHPAAKEAGVLFGAGMVLASSQPAPEADAALLLQLPETNAPLPKARTLFLSLDAYAALRGLEVRSHQVAKPPAMRITAVAPWMPGLEVGHELPWFGKEGDRFTQRSLPADGLPDGARVLAVSTLDQGPILLEEELPDGRRLVALDLESPNGKAGYDPGSKLKWFFIARALDSKAFYGRHVPRRLTVEEYTQQLRDLADQHAGRVTLAEIGKGSAGDPIFVLSLGKKDAPRFVFTGVLHGGEVMNAYGLLRLAEVLLENPAKDARISRLLEEYSVEIIPLLNAWGYAHRKQTNSRDCDLNRNFDYLWEEFTGDGGWRAAIKPEVLRGAAPFSEGESQAVRDRLLAGKVAGYIDFHQHGREHGHMLMLPHRPVQRQP